MIPVVYIYIYTYEQLRKAQYWYKQKHQPHISINKRSVDPVHFSGQSKKLLGKAYKEDIDKMPLEELEKLYTTFQSRLSSTMVKSLGESPIKTYVHAACTELAIKGTEEKPADELSEDPFLYSTIRHLSCNIYYKFSAWLSPLSIGITDRHYIENKPPSIIPPTIIVTPPETASKDTQLP